MDRWWLNYEVKRVSDAIVLSAGTSVIEGKSFPSAIDQFEKGIIERVESSHARSNGKAYLVVYAVVKL